MSKRSEELAEKVRQANQSLLKIVQDTTEEQWNTPSTNEAWNQGFVGYHAASSIGNITSMISDMAAGGTFQPTTFAQIDNINAQFYEEHCDCTKDEALELIAKNAPAAEEFVRGLSDDQLDRQLSLAQGLPAMNIEQIVEMLLVGHPTDHAKSIVDAR